MICQLLTQDKTFLQTWLVLYVQSFVTLQFLAAAFFKYYYVDITFGKFQCKTNPKFPSLCTVRDEIITSAKGLLGATFMSTVALHMIVYKQRQQEGQQFNDDDSFFARILSNYKGYSFGSTAADDADTWYDILYQFVTLAIIIDGTLWAIHYVHHKVHFLWEQHKEHHKYYNPSPFGSSANDMIELSSCSGIPLVVIPFLMPVNIDIALFVITIMFGIFSTYLHTGFEVTFHDAHHPIVSSSYQHYIHHAVSFMNRPIYCGGTFKIWDQVAQSTMPPNYKCKCVSCRPKRTLEQYQTTYIPDYSVMWKQPMKFLMMGTFAVDEKNKQK